VGRPEKGEGELNHHATGHCRLGLGSKNGLGEKRLFPGSCPREKKFNLILKISGLNASEGGRRPVLREAPWVMGTNVNQS